MGYNKHEQLEIDWFLIEHGLRYPDLHFRPLMIKAHIWLSIFAERYANKVGLQFSDEAYDI